MDKTIVQESLFEEFWKCYPKKIAKGAAKKAFIKVKPNKELLDKMIETIKLFKHCEQWNKENGKFIPYPATWLNQERWEDEIFVEAKNGKHSGTYRQVSEFENISTVL